MEDKRQIDLDWIRILATYTVFLYHCSMFFNPFPWHVKNNYVDSSYVLVFSLMVGTWIMPIFFAISGISIFHTLKKRNNSLFIKERFKRLGIPLFFGILILSPPQVYIERVTHNQFSGSFAAFLPSYFDGLYLEIGGEGNFAFVGLHLWYLLVLLVFSLITLPFLRKIRNKTNSFTLRHYLLILITLIIIAQFLNFVNLGGWGLPHYLAIFLFAYYYFSTSGFKHFLASYILPVSILALTTSIIYTVWFIIGHPVQLLPKLLFNSIKVTSSLNSMLLIFYLANRYLSRENKFFKYNSQFSMPLYVLHQPIIVTVGFMIYQLPWPVTIKLFFIIVMSLALIITSYELLITRSTILRLVFGMKANRKIFVSVIERKKRHEY